MQTLLFILVIAFGFFYAKKYGKKAERDIERYKQNEGNSMVLWEDDYLMIELISKENLEFILKETQRIQKHGEEHFDGYGFTEVTQIGEPPYKTKELGILVDKMIEILESVGLKKYDVLYYGGGSLKEIENLKSFVYGELGSAIFLEPKDGTIEHIWIASNKWEDFSKTKIVDGLKSIGEEFDLILVDWNSNQIIDLKKDSEIEKYIKQE